MIAIVQAVAAAAQPWSDLYQKFGAIQASVTFLHLGGMLAAGGFAVAADRATLRAFRRPPEEREAALRELGEVHRPVVIGLAVVVVSGLLMLLADVENLLPSPVFWAKMGVFALLLVNGWVLQRAERRLGGEPANNGAWGKLRGAAIRSAFLWFATVLLGTVLTVAA